MRISTYTNKLLTELEQVEAALLARIPETERDAFLQPLSPFDLTEKQHGVAQENLTKAAELIREAVAKKQRVVIFGDYDCDGVCATAILWETLFELGLSAQPFLPHREKHGYGLSIKALQEVFAQGKPDLLITVDNGIVAHEPFAWLREQGVTTILTDHHEPHDTLPDADVIVHSIKLCGASAAWLVARELNPEIAAKHLDLVGMATIGDQVPLLGANRSFAIAGLKALQASQRPSIRALATTARVPLETLTATQVGFTLVPRLNAMGRLHSAMDALRAVVSRNPLRVQQLANELHAVNGERQTVTSSAFEEILHSLGDYSNEHCIVVAGPYHEGVVGLLASKLVEATRRPSIVISTLGAVGKASARSVPGFHLTQFLRDCKEVSYLALGGHAMAAGFSVPLEKVEEVVESLRASARENIPLDLLDAELEVIGPLSWKLLDSPLLDLLDRFSPFGSENTQPLFSLPNAKIRQWKLVGKDGKHLQVEWIIEGCPIAFKGIWFGFTNHHQPQELESWNEWFIRIERSTFPGKVLEIQIESAR